MATVVVIGTQWGDEGKGKVVDFLAQKADLVVRFQGGHNAGHTVVREDGEMILHLIPAGIFYPGTQCVIGNGVVIDPAALIEEIRVLETKGVECRSRLHISMNAHLIMPYHKAVEKESEKIKGGRRIGTTGRGIGPAYVDKMARIGIRIGDLLDPPTFREKLTANILEMNELCEKLYRIPGFDLEKIYEEYMGYGQELTPYVTDVSLLINRAVDEGRNVLYEGAQGTHLDVDHGTYPYVTSSSATAGGACVGTGVGPTKIDRVIGVAKAYATRVGSGPFPTEVTGDLGESLRMKGREFGATTGRPRRCGWFDAVAVRCAVRVNGLAGLVITKMDVLDSSPEIKICTAYRYKGTLYSEMPCQLSVLEGCEAVYETYKGWCEKTTGIVEYSKLPERAQEYLARIEDLTSCRIDIVSTGSRREETIVKHDPFRIDR